MKKILLMVIMLIAVSTSAYAQCSCVCINNEKTMICENSWDVPTGYCGGWCSSNSMRW